MKYAAVTTFPLSAYHAYAKQMIASYLEFWPKEVPLFIVLDEGMGQQAVLDDLVNSFPGQLVICTSYSDEQRAFLKRHENFQETSDYKTHYVRFSHKVFAVDQMVKNVNPLDYLIWLDADIITQKPITLEDFEKWLPQDGTTVSYMGRKDWSASETGFLAFDLSNQLGKEIIDEWKSFYVSDELLKHEEFTDAYAFDLIFKQRFAVGAKEDAERLNYSNPLYNLTYNVPGRDVFEHSPMGQFMTHYKGPRKKEIAPSEANTLSGKSLNIADMGIRTRNCVQDDTIKENVSMNMRLIRNWLQVCKPHDEEVIICSAGPSLSVDDILPHYRAGKKIVAVKHALQKLLDADIIPWACMLLDPRPHVGDFIKHPHPDITYFVASMVDPLVTKHLLASHAKVVGYHALVGAAEEQRIPVGHVLIQGGSATSTRGLSLLEAMGFRKITGYGYDCCYLARPDLQERKPNGKFKFEEVTLESETWGGGVSKRTFWTEGQFLAQVQEIRNLYLPKDHMSLTFHGEGIIPWMVNHLQKHKKWREFVVDEQITKVMNDAPTLESFLNGTDQSRHTTG